MFEIGNTLREARVRRNLTLQQVEEDTKIRVKYVQAMENEDFDVMPGATYVKGFLRTYSTYLGLDPDVILDEYRSRISPASEKHEPFGGSSVLGKPHSHRGRNTLVFVAVLCLLVLGVIWVLGRGGEQKAPQTSPSALGIGSPVAQGEPVGRVAADGDRTSSRTSSRSTPRSETAGRRCARTAPPAPCSSRARSRRAIPRSSRSKVLWVRLGSPSMVKLVVEGKTQPRSDGDQPRRLHRQGRQAEEDELTWPRNRRSTWCRART